MEVLKERRPMLIVCTFLILSVLVYFIYDSYGQKLGEILQADTTSDCEARENVVSSGEDLIISDLSGAVNKPGVYKLEPESRIVDLIRYGEGFTSQASADWVAKKLNLSGKLTDSQKVYIPFEWEIIGSCYDDTLEIEGIESSSSVKTSKDGNNSDGDEGSKVKKPEVDGKININLADMDDLDTLPGIGPVYAQKIVDNRPYKDAEDLKTKTAISQTTIDKFISQVSF